VGATRRQVPRRDAGRFKKPADVAADDAIHRPHNENELRVVKRAIAVSDRQADHRRDLSG
jgi:hypothetical protein